MKLLNPIIQNITKTIKNARKSRARIIGIFIKQILTLNASRKYLLPFARVHINISKSETSAVTVSTESINSEKIIRCVVSGTSFRMLPWAIENAKTSVQQSKLLSDL